MIVRVLRHTLLHLCDLLRRGFALMLRFPLRKRHAVDDFARLIPRQIAVRFRNPVGQAVAAKARQSHQIDILHIGAMLQMRDQTAEGGCSNGICDYGIGHRRERPFR